MKKIHPAFIIIFLTGLSLKFMFMFYHPINCDEAFMGLIAKHISEFKEFPIFIFKAHYAGTLICYIAAAFFKIFGPSLYILRSIGIVLCWLPFIIFSTLFSKFFRPAIHTFLVFLFVSLPPPSITHFTTEMVGSLPEMLVIGSVLFYLLAKLLTTDEPERERKYFVSLSLLSGVGFWLSPGAVYYLISILYLFWLKDRKFFLSSKFMVFIFLFCLGATPAIIHNLQYPAASIFRFAGRILHLNSSVLSSPDLSGIVFSQILWRIRAIPGCFIDGLKLIYQMATEFMISPLNQKIFVFPFGLFYFFALFLAGLNRKKELLNIIKRRMPVKNIDGSSIYLIYILCFLVLFSFIVCDPVNSKITRFIVPAYIALPFLLSDALLWLKKYSKVIFVIFTSFLISSNIFANLQVLKIGAPESPANYKKLLYFLVSRSLFYGYSNEDIAYSINFLSQEKLTYSPTLLAEFQDRYPEYTKAVDSEANVGYIFNAILQPQKKAFFERSLREKGISFTKEDIYPFVVYYGLTKAIRSADFNIP